MTIKPGTLQYNPDQIFLFVITTKFYDKDYEQTLSVDINEGVYAVPIPKLDCRTTNLCITAGPYKRVSSSNDLIIQAACVEGCSIANITYFNFTLWEANDTNFNWEIVNQTDYITGK